MSHEFVLSRMMPLAGMVFYIPRMAITLADVHRWLKSARMSRTTDVTLSKCHSEFWRG